MGDTVEIIMQKQYTKCLSDSFIKQKSVVEMWKGGTDGLMDKQYSPLPPPMSGV